MSFFTLRAGVVDINLAPPGMQLDAQETIDLTLLAPLELTADVVTDLPRLQKAAKNFIADEAGAIELPLKRGRGGRGGGIEHATVQQRITRGAGGLQEQRIDLPNGRFRIADNIDAQGRIHQVGDMRYRGGFRPSAEERGAIEDIRKAMGPNVDIIFHDKLGRWPSLINPDLQPGWRPAPLRHRFDP